MMARFTSALSIAVLLATLALAAPTGAEESGRRAFEIADYYRTALVGAPVLSPDGRRIAFDVGRYELAAGESWSEVWTMAADGSDLRPMTQGRHQDESPAFSHDGRSLFFLSDRSGSSQVWVMAVDGGEARQLTSFPPGVSDPLVSPDGRHLVVMAEVYPECGADGACNEKIAKARSEGPLQVHVADELLHRHWTAWRDGLYRHVLLVDATSGEVVRDLTPGPFDSPIFSTGGRGYDLSPDGRELAVVSNRGGDLATSTNADLWLVPVDGSGEARNVTAENAGWDGTPRYAPDGRTLAYLSQARPGYESDYYRLRLLDRASGAVRTLVDRTSFDDWIDEIAWFPDGSALLFQGEHHGRTPLYRVGVADGAVAEVHTHALLNGWDLSPDGRRIVYSRRSTGGPHEIFAVPAAGGEAVRLTHLNAALEAEVDLRPAEEMWVKTERGYDVHVLLVKPHGFDPGKTYPLILNVHGGPQSQWADTYRGDSQVYTGKGYVVAFPNPTGSTGYGQDFVDGIACDWGGRVFADLMDVTAALAALPWVDAERMGAMGWSYGGYMTMWFQGHTDRFKAIASMMGIYDLRSFYGATEELWFPEKDLCGTPWTSDDYERWSPSNAVESFKTPALVITGELDFRVPYTQSLQYFTALRRRGVPAELVVFPKSGHWPGWRDMVFYYNAHLAFFHRTLGGGPAPYTADELLRNQVFGKGGP